MKTLFTYLIISSLFSFHGDVKVIKWAELNQIIEAPNNKTKIINFWATWCKPCLEELPYFEQVHKKYKDKNVEVVLVSLDQASLSNKVQASVLKNKITADVVILDEVDFNKWINLVDTTWSGSIPATLIVSKDHKSKKFFEQQLTLKELEEIIHSINQ